MGCFPRIFFEIVDKILQIIVIALLVLYIISLYIDLKIKNIIWLGLLIGFYVLYLFFEFFSPECRFLCNKTNSKGLKEILGQIFKTGPVFKLHCECYHYETRTVRYSPPKKGGGRKKSGGGAKKTVKKSSGFSKSRGGRKIGSRKPRTRTKVKKVVTHRETTTFPYSSSRDISGPFVLDCERDKAMGKVYVRLELDKNISFVDKTSQADYERFKTNFYNRNRHRDKEMSFSETIDIPGFQKYSFIYIRNTEPCGINICLYILFTIIPLVELYKYYISSYCIDQKFTIKKIVSTKGNLNSNTEYDKMKPSIDIPSEKYNFEENEFMYEYKEEDFQNYNQIYISNNQNNQNNQNYNQNVINNNQAINGIPNNDPTTINLNVNPVPSNQNQQQQTPQNLYNDININNNINNNNINDMNNNINTNMNNNINNNMDNNINVNNYNMNNNINNNINMNNNINNNPITYNNDFNVNNNMNIDSKNEIYPSNNDDDDEEDEDDDEPGDAPYLGN